MNIHQVARLIMTGLMSEVPENTRLRIVKIVIESIRKPIKYIDGGTLCPVCSTFGMIGKVTVYRTAEEVRYCDCGKCSAKFVAIGEKREPQIEPEKVIYKHRFKRKKH
jgi:hypothetical protein